MNQKRRSEAGAGQVSSLSKAKQYDAARKSRLTSNNRDISPKPPTDNKKAAKLNPESAGGQKSARPSTSTTPVADKSNANKPGHRRTQTTGLSTAPATDKTKTMSRLNMSSGGRASFPNLDLKAVATQRERDSVSPLNRPGTDTFRNLNTSMSKAGRKTFTTQNSNRNAAQTTRKTTAPTPGQLNFSRGKTPRQKEAMQKRASAAQLLPAPSMDVPSLFTSDLQSSRKAHDPEITNGQELFHQESIAAEHEILATQKEKQGLIQTLSQRKVLRNEPKQNSRANSPKARGETIMYTQDLTEENEEVLDDADLYEESSSGSSSRQDQTGRFNNPNAGDVPEIELSGIENEAGDQIENAEFLNEMFQQMKKEEEKREGVRDKSPAAGLASDNQDRLRPQSRFTYKQDVEAAATKALNEPRIYANRLLGKTVNTTDKIVMSSKGGQIKKTVSSLAPGTIRGGTPSGSRDVSPISAAPPGQLSNVDQIIQSNQDEQLRQQIARERQLEEMEIQRLEKEEEARQQRIQEERERKEREKQEALKRAEQAALKERIEAEARLRKQQELIRIQYEQAEMIKRQKEEAIHKQEEEAKRKMYAEQQRLES